MEAREVLFRFMLPFNGSLVPSANCWRTMMQHVWKRPYLLVLIAQLLVVPSQAQTFRGQITGLVVDPQGAAIQSAAVRLLSPATGTLQEGKSNHAGEFVFPELTPGMYQVTVVAP